MRAHARPRRASATQHVAEFPTTVRGPAGAARLAGRARRDAGRDGGDRRVLEAGLGSARGRLRVDAGQRPPRQAGPGPQDRRLRRRVDLPAGRGGLLRASFVPPKPIRDAAQPDALSQDADRRSARARPTGCTRRWRTPASSSTASPPTSSASRAARCSTRSSPGTTDPEVLAELARGRLRAEAPGAARGARGPL